MVCVCVMLIFVFNYLHFCLYSYCYKHKVSTFISTFKVTEVDPDHVTTHKSLTRK